MGRRSASGGVEPKGSRIQLTFSWLGKRVRPTLELAPTQTNLRAARRRLQEIKAAIADGRFDFRAEFPDYRHLPAAPAAAPERTVKVVCAAFIDSLRARRELAFATVESYRKILAHHVEPELGARPFAAVTFDELNAIANAHQGTKKTFNNVVSAIRQAWDFGFKALPGKTNPALGLAGVRIPRKEQPRPDPFPIAEAEAVIAAIRKDWGESQGNYDEFRFFTGLRPSEQIALEWSDLDWTKAQLAVTKARVMARAKDETKNYEDRLVELNPRALEVLRRQRALYSSMKLAGTIAAAEDGQPHQRIFFHENGRPFNDLQVPWKRWDYTMQVTLKRRERTPYNARHSSVSWNLMMGKNLLWVAKQHGHSAAVMLKTYARWIDGADEEEVARITRAFGFATDLPLVQVANAPTLLIAKDMHWRSERDSNPHPPVAGSASYSVSQGSNTPPDPLLSPDLPPDLPPAEG